MVLSPPECSFSSLSQTTEVVILEFFPTSAYNILIMSRGFSLLQTQTDTHCAQAAVGIHLPSSPKSSVSSSEPFHEPPEGGEKQPYGTVATHIVLRMNLARLGGSCVLPSHSPGSFLPGLSLALPPITQLACS